MKFLILYTIFITILLIQVSAENDEELSIYGNVPGLDSSPFYHVKVKKETSSNWLNPFTFVTECTAEKFCNTTGVYRHLHDWSNSYVNFEMKDGVSVEIVINKLFGEPIHKAVVHPYAASENCVVRNGKAYVTINKPGLFTVDINGQMDDQGPNDLLLYW